MSQVFGTGDSKCFDASIIERYYEVVMCRNFLNYVKKFYPNLFFSDFSDFNASIIRRLVKIDKYINNAMYDGSSIVQTLTSGEILGEMLSIFKNKTEIESLTLMFDRFDCIHNSDPRIQMVLKNYFDMFGKVILTSDDSSKKRIDSLVESSYSFVYMDHSLDLNTIVDIVERRFELAEEMNANFFVDDVFDDDYLKVIDKCGGNINTILDIFQYAETLRKWESSKDLSTIIEDACIEKVNGVKQFGKMYNPPKLHL